MIDEMLLTTPEELVESLPETGLPGPEAADVSVPETELPVPEAADASAPEIELPASEPDAPSVPEVPETPELPQSPEMPETPDTPSDPEAPAPRDDPETAEAAESQEAPTEPEAPAAEQEQGQEDVDVAGRRRRLPYHQRAYLLYAGEPEARELDLDGTIAFLRDLGFDGGELRQARKGKDYSEAMKSQDTGGGIKMNCSYCGVEISGVDYYRMPDGRMRCSTCSRTMVKTKEELTKIYKRILNNMEVFFGASFDVPINIEMLDERNLKKKIKHPLGEVDGKNPLFLGLAVHGKKDYFIYLENGAPKISVIATFAHELTHIWQYTQGRRGGHGRDFYKEMERIGIQEREQLCQNGSPADTILLEAKNNHPNLCNDFHNIYNIEVTKPENAETTFFVTQVLRDY